MNLYFRLLLAYLQSTLLQRIRTSKKTTHWFRVWPQDIDLYGHMNNGRYSQIMDVARFAWLIQTGTVDVLRKNGWNALLGGSIVRFRRSLKLFQHYSVTTKLVYYDDRWYYLEHIVCNKAGEICASAIVKAAFRTRHNWVITHDALAVIDPTAKQGAIPEKVKKWIETEGITDTLKSIKRAS